MRSTKAASLPLMYSAMATAQSLAETTAMHLSMSETVMRSPSSSHTWLPPMEAASAEAVTSSESVISPPSTASAMSSMVITLVTEAGGRRSSAFFS